MPAPTPSPPSNRPPLGLPRGSIRALLTLMIVAVVIAQMVRGGEIHLLWTETLMIAMAHYFASRRFIRLPPEETQAAGQRRSYRIGGPAALSAQLQHPAAVDRLVHGRGHLISTCTAGCWNRRPCRFWAWCSPIYWESSFDCGQVRGWEDAKAAVVLAVMLATSTAYLLDYGGSVPKPLQAVTLGLVLFYFGSR